MSLDQAARIVADAILGGARRQVERQGRSVSRATVTSLDPLRVDLHGVDLELDDDDLTMSDDVRAGLEVGHVLTLAEVDEGDYEVASARPGE